MKVLLNNVGIPFAWHHMDTMGACTNSLTDPLYTKNRLTDGSFTTSILYMPKTTLQINNINNRNATTCAEDEHKD